MKNPTIKKLLAKYNAAASELRNAVSEEFPIGSKVKCKTTFNEYTVRGYCDHPAYLDTNLGMVSIRDVVAA